MTHLVGLGQSDIWSFRSFAKLVGEGLLDSYLHSQLSVSQYC